MPPPQNKTPDFIPAQPDFIPASQPQSISTPAPVEQPGLLENLGHAFGIGKQEADEDAKHPIRAGIAHLAEALPGVGMGVGAWNGAKRIGGELKGISEAQSANDPKAALSHAISAIPFVGPAMDKMADESPASKPGQSYASKVWADATPGNVGTAVGTAAQVAPMVLGGLDAGAPERPLLGQLPSASRAGRVLQDIREQAKDVPLSFEKTTPELDRFMELTQRGGRASKPFTQLSRRIDPSQMEQPEPVNFPEGRDFYSNISDAAHQTPLQKIMGRGMKPTMRRQAVNVRRAFNDDLTSAADEVGRGEDYTNAMKEYANAKRLQKIAKGAALLGAGEAARRTGLLGNWIHRTALTQ